MNSITANVTTQHLLDVALQASELAADIIRHYYHNQHFSVTTKSDNTPVTEVDVKVEQAIKSFISEQFPDHGFYGEEEGQQHIEADYVWLIDPIDGTKAFVRGRPFFSTQIALMHQKEFILGVSTAPAYNGGERAYAVKGEGAFLNQQPIQVSPLQDLNQAVLSSGNIKSLAKSAHSWQNYADILQQVSTTRGFGDFLHYHLLASGKLDIIIESDVSILDVAALSVIVTEAGGIMTQLDGSPLTLSSTNILAAAPTIHAQLIQQLAYSS